MSIDTQVPAPMNSAPNVDGVLAGRFFGFFIDLILISFLWAFVVTLVLFLGFATMGAVWVLFFAPLFPVLALLYNGFTVGGRKQATPGMRLFGVKMQMAESGGEVSFLIAAVHAIFYYLSLSVPFVFLIGLIRSDSRLLHDLLTGVIAVRRS